MKITVAYTTQLKAALGVASEDIEVEADATVGDVVKQLAALHSDEFSQFVLNGEGQLLPSIILCVGEEQIAPGDATPLRDGDTVTFLSAISGG